MDTLRAVDHDLPSFSIRVSPRAKRAKLVCSAGQGLVVVLPKGSDPALAPALVARHKAWAERVLRRLGASGAQAVQPPDELCLHAVDCVVRLDYVRRAGQATRLNARGPDRLLVSGDPESPGYLSDLRALLQAWLRRRAALDLPSLVREQSLRSGLSCSAVRFRAQRMRWGSCTSAGVLHLNAKLLFLPRELAGFVILHELCHTVHMDHSSRFKALLASHEPDMERLDAALRSAGTLVPALLN